MAETIPENEFCEACGADIRPEALFCYHCGGPVTEEAVLLVKEKSTAVVVEETAEGAEAEESAPDESDAEEADENSSEPKEETGSQKKKPELKSASSIRNRTRRVQPKKIEIIWEEHENAPNFWFISVAVILTVFALTILFLAMYLG